MTDMDTKFKVTFFDKKNGKEVSGISWKDGTLILCQGRCKYMENPNDFYYTIDKI